MPSDRRACKATNKAGGPCKAAPLTGKEHCLAHADEEARASTGFGGPQPNAGRPPRPRVVDIERRLMEENYLAWAKPYWRVLGFDVVIDGGLRLVPIAEGGAKLYGTSARSGEIVVSEHEDLGAMIAAAEKLRDRVFGKPRQAVEHTGEDGGPIEVSQTFDLAALSIDERRMLLALVEKMGGEGE